MEDDYVASISNDAASIGRAVTVKGEVFSNEDLFIDGALEGRIELPAHVLTVGPNGTIKTGVIKAAKVVIQGAVQGDVNAQERVEIRKDGSLTGNIRTARIVIEEGAYFKGGVDIAKPGAAD
jgi:cytoskeletal protein CcmA (bactofilin family)